MPVWREPKRGFLHCFFDEIFFFWQKCNTVETQYRFCSSTSFHFVVVLRIDHRRRRRSRSHAFNTECPFSFHFDPKILRFRQCYELFGRLNLAHCVNWNGSNGLLNGLHSDVNGNSLKWIFHQYVYCNNFVKLDKKMELLVNCRSLINTKSRFMCEFLWSSSYIRVSCKELWSK